MSDEQSVLTALSGALFVAGIECTLPQSVIDAVADEIRWAIAEAVVGELEKTLTGASCAYPNIDREGVRTPVVIVSTCMDFPERWNTDGYRYPCPRCEQLHEWRAKLPARNAEEA